MRLAQKKTYTWLLQNLMHLVTFPQARNVARCAYCALQIRFHDERDIQDVWDSDQSSFLTNIKAHELRVWFWNSSLPSPSWPGLPLPSWWPALAVAQTGATTCQRQPSAPMMRIEGCQNSGKMVGSRLSSLETHFKSSISGRVHSVQVLQILND